MLGWGFFVAQWLGYGCSFNSTEFSCESLQSLYDSAVLTFDSQGDSLLLSKTSLA